MIGLVKRIVCGLNDVVNIILMGDFHVGNIASREDKIKQMVSWIKNKDNCYWIDVGDKIEAINISDKRWDGKCIPRWIQVHELKDLVNVQQARYVELVKPIRDRCLGLVEGNHENKLYQVYERDIHQEICSGLGVPNLTGAALVRLMFRREGTSHSSSVTLFVTHGYGAGRTAGAKLNKLKGFTSSFEADVYVMGHCHDKVSKKDKVIALNRRGELIEKSQVMVATSSFFQTYVKGITTYAERSLFSPTCTGATRLMIKPFVIQREWDGQRRQNIWLKALAPDIHVSE